MSESKIEKPKGPFRFYTRVHLPELTGLRAKNIEELLAHIKSVSESVIYYHTHHFLKQHQFLNPEPPNDFAYWVIHALNETELGEKLASINTCEFKTIQLLREKIISTFEGYLKKSKRQLISAHDGQEFYFIKSVSFIFPTSYVATTLAEFSDLLKKVTIDSFYFHMFEARLRLEKGINDFSNWLENEQGEKDLAMKIAKLDPYTHTNDRLREKIVRLMEHRILEKAAKTGKESRRAAA